MNAQADDEGIVRAACDGWMPVAQLVESRRDGQEVLPADSQSVMAFRALALQLAACGRPLVLVALESVGWDLAARATQGRSRALYPVTTVAPSSPLAAWTSALQGCPPAEHGVYGTAFPMQGAGPTVASFCPFAFVGGQVQPIVMPRPMRTDDRSPLFQELALLGFCTEIWGMAAELEATPWLAELQGPARFRAGCAGATPEQVVVAALDHLNATLARAGDPLACLLYLDFDDHVHACGQDTTLAAAVAQLADGLVDLRRRRGMVALGVSDHGVVPHTPRLETPLSRDPEILALSRADPGGAGRTQFFYPHPGATGPMRDLLEARLGPDAVVHDRDSYCRRYLGEHAPRAADRIGDLVAVARTSAFPSPTSSMRFDHGACSPDEMLAVLALF